MVFPWFSHGFPMVFPWFIAINHHHLQLPPGSSPRPLGVPQHGGRRAGGRAGAAGAGHGGRGAGVVALVPGI